VATAQPTSGVLWVYWHMRVNQKWRHL
jgi:hypothetical protein